MKLGDFGQLGQHCTPQHVIARTDSVNRQNGGTWIRIGDCPYRMSHAIHAFSTSAPNWRASLRDQPPESDASGNSSDTSVTVGDCCHGGKQRTPAFLRCSAPYHVLSCKEQELGDSRVIQAHFEHFIRTSTRSWCAGSWRTAEALNERVHVQSQRLRRFELHHLPRNGSDLFPRPLVLQSSKSLVVLGSKGSANTWRALDTCPC